MFPTTFLYSFKGSQLWLSLTFLPETESITQLRYDLFASSQKAESGEDNLTIAVEAGIQSLIAQLETEYRSIAPTEVEDSASTQRILAHLHDHAKLERARGARVLPAMRQPKGSSLYEQAEQRKRFSRYGLHLLRCTDKD